MRKSLVLFLAALLLALVPSCESASPIAAVNTTQTTVTPGAEVPEASPQPVPKPSPSPDVTPSPTPVPTPIPTPTPTPTPDPWAGFFTTGGAYVAVADQDKGPWIYRDERLNIRIDLMSSGKAKYLRAEIYTRGPLPQGCFANQNTSGSKLALPYLIARQNKAVLAITSDFVTHRGNDKGVMIRLGRVYHDKKKAPTLAVLPDGELKAYEPGMVTAKQLQALRVKDSFAFGPILVIDGKIHKSVRTHSLRSANKRSSIGMVEKGHYICIVTISGFTLEGLANLYIRNKCTVAYNLDGGHSASMVFMGEQLFKAGYNDLFGGQRPLADMLAFGSNPAVPGPQDAVYCNGNSYNKKNRPQPKDGPIG